MTLQKLGVHLFPLGVSEKSQNILCGGGGVFCVDEGGVGQEIMRLIFFYQKVLLMGYCFKNLHRLRTGFSFLPL